MDFTFNSYGLILLFFGALTALIAFYIYKRGGEVVRLFAAMMTSNAIWSIAYGLELSSTSLTQAMFFVNVEYLGIATLPVTWFLFSLCFTNKECWYKKPINLAALLVMPIVTIAIVWTNPWHNLHYKKVEMVLIDPFPMLKIYPGIWYRIFTVYFYLLLASGFFLIVNKFKTADPIFRKQNYTIIIAGLIPWFANLAYLLGFRPLGTIDMTPFAFIFTTFLILFNIYRFRLFDIVPIAREKVLELMTDGFVVLDDQYRIIDYNSALAKYIDIAPKRKLVGYNIDEVFVDNPELILNIKSGVSGKLEIQNTVNDKKITTEAEILFSNESKVSSPFTIVKLQDLTAAKLDSKVAKDQALELEKLNQLKDRIFSIISHDLRGPLVNLSEVLKMVAQDLISDKEFKEISPALSKDIIYTTDLLENLLHWSRSQLKGFGISKEFFNVRNVVLNEINYHLPAANLKHINIIHDIFPNEVAYADVLMFQIVVRNIINNAIKFCHSGCDVHISANYGKDKMINIRIKDSGTGISTEFLEKLFTDDNISSRGTQNEKGTGLGLMICKDFMNRNGGDISVESEMGKGTTFLLTLPTQAI